MQCMSEMNDIFELWSLPWHALQRSLADGFGTETSASGPVHPLTSGSDIAAPGAANWLMRARRTASRALAQASR